MAVFILYKHYYHVTSVYKLCLLTYKTLTNQQPAYLYNNLSFPSHLVSTRSSDSIVLSIRYVRFFFDRHLSKVLSLSSVHDSGIHSLLIPKFVFFTNIPFQALHTSSKLRFLPRLCSISLDCLPWFWFLLFLYFMPYWMTPIVLDIGL